MNIDLLPTIAGIVGAELPPHKIDGLDIWPLLTGRPGAASPHEAYFFYYDNERWELELQAVRSGNWKLVLPHTYRTLAGQPGGKDGKPAKYQVATAGLELYDLQNDVSEEDNVAARHPEVVKRLQTLAERAREDLGDARTGRTGRNVRQPGRLAELE